jgi:hypothetical protein
MALLASGSGSKAVNAAWLSSPAIVPHDGPIVISFSLATGITAAQLQVTLDGGTSWQGIGAAPAITANTIYEITLNVSKGAQINVRQTSATITLNRLEIHF